MPEQNLLSDDLFELIPKAYRMQHKLVLLGKTESVLRIASGNENSVPIKDDLEFMTGLTIQFEALSIQELESLLEEQCGPVDVHTIALESGLGDFELIEKEAEKPENGALRRELDEVSVIALVNKIITTAIDHGMSDIHIEAYDGIFRVRYRQDGLLREVMQPPMEKKRAIVSRIKIMADLDIAERRRPQDGRIRVKRADRIIDIRVSTLPTDFGEKIVMRILDKSQLNLDLENLGFPPAVLKTFKKTISIPYGMILVTGPTGSGKTTTLYATLNHLNSVTSNILTIEDPIEYNLQGINQSQVKADIGYTFSNALRSFLRQDPDIIMVGEIRDQETAEIAIRSALTGHLVLSTLHTNNAPDTLTRLLDMGQEPFLISSSVKLVVAQRLLRTLCEQCKVENQKEESFQSFKDLNLTMKLPKVIYSSRGCNKCGHTGYKGRTAIFEVLSITETIADAINRKASAREIRDLAISEGMHTLQMSAVEKLAQGITSMEEVLRETGFVMKL